MATCKDCAYAKVCKFFPYNKTKSACEHFKDRSRFVELPCLQGDKVFLLSSYDKKISECTVFSMSIMISSEHRWFQLVLENKRGAKLLDFHFSDIGKTIFLTREEAEAAMKERKTDG